MPSTCCGLHQPWGNGILSSWLYMEDRVPVCCLLSHKTWGYLLLWWNGGHLFWTVQPTEMEHLHTYILTEWPVHVAEQSRNRYKACEALAQATFELLVKVAPCIVVDMNLTMQALTVCAVTVFGADRVTVGCVLNCSTHTTSGVLDVEVFVRLGQFVGYFLFPVWLLPSSHTGPLFRTLRAVNAAEESTWSMAP